MLRVNRSLLIVSMLGILFVPYVWTQTNRKPTQQAVQQSKQQYKTIKDGVGIEGIAVGRSTSKDVIKRFGGVYRWEVNKKYSYQMTYDSLGLSFYFCQNDKTEQIFLIEIKSPYKGKTNKGVILGKSTKEETIKLYGQPSDGFEYPGIHFYYNRYGNRNIISEIDIIERSGLRQCDTKK